MGKIDQLSKRLDRLAPPAGPVEVLLVFGRPGEPGTWAEVGGQRVPMPSAEELRDAVVIGGVPKS